MTKVQVKEADLLDAGQAAVPKEILHEEISKNKPIFVTQPNLPPLDKFVDSLKEIWESRWLTNNGAYHQRLEKKVCDYLGVKHCSLMSNGTLALIIAFQALKLKGEVITTPFSFVATTHSLQWNGLKPVFCDIDRETFNIDVKKIEALITPQTSAICAVHVYGTPCDVDEIQRIADAHKLKVIYDAAHAFNVKINGRSLLTYGDLSVLSFHATKVFSTIEGGAIITNDEKLKKEMEYLKNFGFADEVTVVSPGINAKMNEIQAAFGLLAIESVENETLKRKQIASFYRNQLSQIEGIRFMEDFPEVISNYSYFPVWIDEEVFGLSRDQVYENLKQHKIYSRRYFYPLISKFSPYNQLASASASNLPVAEEVARGILCLPIYSDLDLSDVKKICNLISSWKKEPITQS